MTVRIKRPNAPTAILEAPKGAPTGTKPAVGGMNLAVEPGKVKFLVHRTKAGIWYRIREYDPATRALKLSTVHDKGTFPSSANRVMETHYALVVEKEGATAPSEAAIKKIQKGGK